MRKRMKPKFHPLSDYQPKFKIMINFFLVYALRRVVIADMSVGE